MTDREVFRLAPPVVFWWVWLAFVAANVADYTVQGLPSARFGAILAAILLLVTGMAYTLALRPRVLADADGLTVVNPYRVHRLPWTVIESVDAAEWVRVCPAAGKAVYCWALFLSAGAKRKVARADARAAHGPPSSRLPEEARYLASLPPAKAIAVRLNSRAARERSRAPASAAVPGTAVPGTAAPGTAATAAWSVPALAAVAVPALILLAVAVA